MTIVDNYFPFDTGPGATATPARWRLMARLWSGSGVISAYSSTLTPSLAGSVVTVQPGAAWIDGYYGEINVGSPKTVSISGNGMVVVRMDPTLRQILVVFVAGQTVPTQVPNGIYEVPLMQVVGSTGTDIRQYALEASSIIPPGTIWEYGGGTIPPGWLPCDGHGYSTTNFAALFNAIGYSWGGSGGTFNVPNCVNRFSIGAGSTLGLGASGGSSILVAANLPPHAHFFNALPHTHNFPATNVATFPTPGTGNLNVTGGGNNDMIGITGLVTSSEHPAVAGNTSNGPGTSAPFLPPAIGINKMIKT